MLRDCSQVLSALQSPTQAKLPAAAVDVALAAIDTNSDDVVSHSEWMACGR